MAEKKYSSYQQKLIRNYYQNFDTIALQKLQEIVTEIYLADSQKKQDRLWLRAQKAMQNLKIPKSITEHIMQKKDVEILAGNLNEWLKTSDNSTGLSR
ncbi:MAG: hypothetical protein ABIG61_02705 [Planctomycetota bacterium]